MSLTTGRRLNHQSFTPLPLPQDSINGVHCLALRNTKSIDIQDRDQPPFLESEDRKNYDEDDSTYAPSDEDISNNDYESDNNQNNHDNLNPPSDQEMAHQPTGVTMQNENAGVHQKRKIQECPKMQACTHHRVGTMILKMTPLSKWEI